MLRGRVIPEKYAGKYHVFVLPIIWLTKGVYVKNAYYKNCRVELYLGSYRVRF